MKACGRAREQARRRQVERQRSNLARYFSPAVVERLAQQAVPFEAERAERAAVMFVDLVGFTTMAERSSPHAVTHLLRSFHELVERAVFAHEGSVQAYMGDGAMACFGLPEHRRNPALDAVQAALQLLRDVACWRREHAAAGETIPPVSIGIHAGPVLMADLGGRQQAQFTVVGDTVNVAEPARKPHPPLPCGGDRFGRRDAGGKRG